MGRSTWRVAPVVDLRAGRSIQGALGACPQHAKSDDDPLDFYEIYRKVAAVYDSDYVQRRSEDLSITLILVSSPLFLTVSRLINSQAGLFSAVSSAFVVDLNSKLDPDPSEDILRAILFTLNQTAILGEHPASSNVYMGPGHGPPGPPGPPGPDGPPGGNSPGMILFTVAAMAIYLSLLTSLLTALLAILLKQGLNLHLVLARGSVIGRCADRQRRYDGLQKWSFVCFDQLLPVLLCSSPICLILGVCARIGRMNCYVSWSVRAFTLLGLAVYFKISFDAAMSLRKHRAPRSTAPPGLRKNVGSRVTAACRSLYERLPRLPALVALRGMWEVTRSRILQVLRWLLPVGIDRRSRRSSLPTVQPTPQEHTSPLITLWGSIQGKIPSLDFHLPRTLPPSTIQDTSPDSTITSPWLAPAALDELQKTNANDVSCVSWILWSITDQQALDAAIQFAGTIQWFEVKLDTKNPYDQIISTLETCFNSTGELYPGSRDRAYYSARAVLWIHTRAMCVSESFALRFPLPTIPYNPTGLDRDLGHLLGMCTSQNTCEILAQMYRITPGFTPAYSQWTSNALLHLSWAKRGVAGMFDSIARDHAGGDWSTVPLNAVLNRLLTWCIFLDWPIDKLVLRVQDKSCVAPCFCPSSRSHRYYQPPLGAGYISIIQSNRFDNPHLPPSTRSSSTHAG